jgi:glutamyl-Q tRNA(Asp) synthetase
MPSNGYIGRFAPSPSGPLHFGSIVTALGSYLQARQRKGKWLVRIEDIDTQRTVNGADKIILHQLENLGLFWDDEVVYQSQRIPLYESALERLNKSGLTFPCACTRKEIAESPYSCTCRNGIAKGKTGRSIRIKTDDRDISFNDKLQGSYSQSLHTEVGDFVIKRADGQFAYHLAVVVDDAEQSITDIVRGADLIDSTPRQIYLQKLLESATPHYTHLPVVIDKYGNKLSKASTAKADYIDNPAETLTKALVFLGQSPEKHLSNASVQEILQWAINNWTLKNISQIREITLD